MRSVIVFCRENLRRAAWLALLENQPGILSVFAASTLSELQTIFDPENQTSIFVDLPEIDVGWIAKLKSAVPNGGLLILVEAYEIEQAVSFLQAGATGLINHQVSIEEFIQSMIAVGRDEIVLPPELASKVMLALARGNVKSSSSIESLTDREQEVLSLLARGLTNKDIAQSLFLSVRTIEAHLRNVYGKLKVTSRTEAVLWAVQHDLEL